MDRFSEESPADLSRNLREYRDDLDDYREQFYELCPAPVIPHCARCGMTKRELQLEAAAFTIRKVPVCREGPGQRKNGGWL